MLITWGKNDGIFTVALDVKLVDTDLAGEAIPGFLQVHRVLHVLDDANGIVDCDAELVVSRRLSGVQGERCRDKDQ